MKPFEECNQRWLGSRDSKQPPPHINPPPYHHHHPTQPPGVSLKQNPSSMWRAAVAAAIWRVTAARSRFVELTIIGACVWRRDVCEQPLQVPPVISWQTAERVNKSYRSGNIKAGSSRLKPFELFCGNILDFLQYTATSSYMDATDSSTGMGNDGADGEKRWFAPCAISYESANLSWCFGD